MISLLGALLGLGVAIETPVAVEIPRVDEDIEVDGFPSEGVWSRAWFGIRRRP